MAFFTREFEHLKIKLEDIKRATNNFAKSKVIGSGGFGAVYEGEVSHSNGPRSMVAFKRLDRKFGQGDLEFWKEIMMLSRYTHPNLISLLGFCNEGGERVLVYEHASNGSVDRHLRSTALTWSQRIKICLDAARGLGYLHEDKGTHQRVLHRDIKSSNILLDENWNAKVSDMGLSKVGPANQQYTALFTNIVGTFGYVDPVYLQMGVLTKESDVYSFGVVLIEVLCGRLCFSYENDCNRLTSLVDAWKKSYTDKKLEVLIFEDVKQPINPISLETFSDIAFLCLHEYREERPPMSLVVKKLEMALKFQVSHDLKLPEEYVKIVEAVVGPLFYRSIQELEVLLSKGLLLNQGKTWFSLNEKGQHSVLISIDECLDSYYKDEYYNSRYSLDYNSRFQVGTFNTCGQSFKTRVRSQFLSPGTTYMVNLVFKCPQRLKHKSGKQKYVAIIYRILKEKEKRSSIVYLADKKDDEWLMAGLYQFTTSTNNQTHSTILDLRIQFDYHWYWKGNLEIEGIEFRTVQKVEFEHDDQVVLDQYQEILDAVHSPPLTYRSVQELKRLLSRGVLLNRGKTWFYINDNGQHCEMISIAECLLPEKNHYYSSHYNSRFPMGSLDIWKPTFGTRVRTQFLSPYITYTVNLVFRFHKDNEKDNTVEIWPIALEYKLNGEIKTRISSLANKREDNWWMLELCQFTSAGRTVDLEIIFHGTVTRFIIEGIEFQPLEKADHKILWDEIEKEDMQSILDSDDSYWEKKLPNDYKDIIKWSKDSPQLVTKKELYSIFCTGFLINNGQEWFSLNDKGLHHVMISIDTLASYKGGDYRTRYSYDYNSRFQVGTYNTRRKNFSIRGRYFNSSVGSKFLSPGITYMVNLVFKCPDVFKKKHTGRQAYIAITYRIEKEKEKRSSIVHIGDKREDEWLVAELYHFTTTNNHSYALLDLHVDFDRHEYWEGGLEIEGIEFQPLENVEFKHDDLVLIDEYQKILEAAAYPPLIFRSVQELKLLLSRGILLNRGKTWFYLDDNGQHCKIISMKECLISDAYNAHYSSKFNSRFPVGSLFNLSCKFRTLVRTHFLSPYITYTVNLVFKFYLENKNNTAKQFPISLNYSVDGRRHKSFPYIAHRREDNWWMVELFQFTSDRKTVDLQISFEGSNEFIVQDGIEFRPLKNSR